MTETTFVAISSVAIFLGILAWAVASGRAVINRRLGWIVVAGLGVIGLWLVMRFALPEAAQRPAVALLGLALSGVLAFVAIRYRDRLPPGQTRHMIIFALVGAVLTILGFIAE